MNCPKCGNEIASNAAFCEHCGQEFTQQSAVGPVPEKRENFLTGIVGALIGAAIGGGAIILLSQLGYVASLSGLILAVCTLKGYELLGGKLSVKGIVVCLLLMAVMPYLADRIDWAIVVMNAYADQGVTLGDAFAEIPNLIEMGMIEKAEYIKNLLMIYAFAVLGAAGTLINLFKKK